MPDPLHVLPNEVSRMCIEFAIAGRLNGPLDFLMVSTRWGSFLLNSPPLWTRIYIQNGEDEMSRIFTFLHLSKQYPLHVDVVTVLPTVDSLQLVAEHISRVRTISIRPGASDNVTALHAKQWKLAASYVLAMLSNGMHLSVAESPACFGFSILDDGQPCYHVVFMQFRVAARAASSDELNHTWEEHIEKAISAAADQYYWNRPVFISVIVGLASYVEFREAIASTIPSLIQILGDEEREVRWAAAEAIFKLVNHVEFREAIASTIPSLIELFEDEDEDVRSVTVGIVSQLVNHVEFHEGIASTIPSLIELLEDEDEDVRSETVGLVGQLANHAEFRRAVETTVPALIKLLEDDYSEIRSRTVRVVGELANYIGFREAIISTIPSTLLIERLEDHDPDVRLETVKAVGKLAKHVEFCEAITPVIPTLVRLLEDDQLEVLWEADRVVGDMESSGMFQLPAFAIFIREWSVRRR